MPTIRNPHDEFFKALMNEKAMAKTYFQHFLPADIVEHLNFEQLELDSNSYITPELELTFRKNQRGKNKKDKYVTLRKNDKSLREDGRDKSASIRELRDSEALYG